MRPAYLNFEDLVKQYEQELWDDERQIKQMARQSDEKENAAADQKPS